MSTVPALAQRVCPETLPAMTYEGKPVVTTAVLAQLYGTDEVRVRQNHKRNADRFVPGKHMFKVEGKALSDLRVSSGYSQIPAKARSVILWTERGAARHAKMLETNQAWDVFEALEDHYFSQEKGGVPEPEPEPKPVPLILAPDEVASMLAMCRHVKRVSVQWQQQLGPALQTLGSHHANELHGPIMAAAKVAHTLQSRAMVGRSL